MHGLEELARVDGDLHTGKSQNKEKRVLEDSLRHKVPDEKNTLLWGRGIRNSTGADYLLDRLWHAICHLWKENV